jgi:DNA (cytosine-5)-methyltransferase 1
VSLNYLDLFSGIGGFAYACRLADIRFANHYFSEIDPYAIKVYKKQFPDAVPLGDIRRIDYGALKEANGERWFLTGGFPCQDLSTAGKQRGINAERSGLWWELLRAIAELRPQAALIENVPALANRGFERVLLSLAEAGYDAEWDCISAASVGAPHKRERIWIVAYPCDDRLQDRLYQQSASVRNVGNHTNADANDQREDTWADWQTVAASGMLHSQPGVCRMADGLPGWLDRIACLGNAIVPQVAAKLLTQMKPLLKG